MVSAFLSTVDLATLPSPLVPIVEILKWGFLATPIAVGLGFARSITGYSINKLAEARKEDPEQIDYSLAWLGKTLVTFEGWVLTVTPLVNAFVLNLPPEEQHIAMLVTGSAFALIDLLLSEIKHIVAVLRQ